MQLRTAVLSFTAAALLGSSAALAEPLRLSLDDAVHMALSEGTAARLARSAQERAEISKREALYGLFPQGDARLMRYSESINLQTFGFAQPGEPPVVGPFDVYDGQITAQAQLFNLAAIRLYESRSAGARASRYQLEQTENDVVTAVARLYVLVQRADAQVSTREADVKLFGQLARVAQDEFDSGVSTRLDVAQANVQLARARESLLVAENDRQTAGLALLNAIGADQSTDVALVDPFPAPQSAPDVAGALAAAQQNRPELKALAERKREADLLVSAAKSQWVPKLVADYQGDISGNTKDDMYGTRRIGASISFPLFRAQIPTNIALAKAQALDVETQTDAITRDVEQDVRRSIMTLQNTEERVKVAQENVTVAEEALTIARDRRSAGYGSAVEVDRAEDSYRQAHEALISAQADAALALYQVQHATGEIRSHVGGGTK